MRAFTLVELLVVITIVVILLAMLTPAVDKAVYRAELLGCAGRLRAFGVGVVSYASQYQRRYPTRKGLVGGGRREITLVQNWWPDGSPAGMAPATGAAPPPLIGFVAINKTLNCPFAKPVDLESQDPNANILTGYGRWYSWRYGQRPGMFKLGEHFEFRGDLFRVVAGDSESNFSGSSNGIQEGHPDKEGVLHNFVWDNVSAGFATRTYIASLWVNEKADVRGPTDRICVRDDTSVSFFDDLVIDDPRLVIVPYSDYDDGTVAPGSSNRDALPAN